MNKRHSLSTLAVFLAGFMTVAVQAEETASSRALSFSLKKGVAPTHVALIWKDAILQGMEIRAKAGGPVLQRIKIGEFQTIACDLDQENLPPQWIGTLDYDGDGWQDLYLQVAQGAEPTHAILLYDSKAKRFATTKALSSVRGLDLGAAGAAKGTPGRKLEESFGLVSKESMKPIKLSIGGRPLQKGDQIAVLQFGDHPAVLSAEINERMEPANGESEATYTVTCVPEPAPEEAFVGIGVLGAIHGITFDQANLVSTRVAAGPAGSRLYFRTCTSGEGMHLTVWAGRPLTGRRVWHRYHSLGYDVEPNCTAKDYREEQ